jgi:O-antigen/teichoic acid export membrane protein
VPASARATPPAGRGPEAAGTGQPAPSPGPESGSDSITRNAAFGLATQLTTAAFTAGLTLYLVRALGPGDYGVFALALSIGTLLMLASDFGLSGSAGRFIAEHRGDPHAVAGFLFQTVTLKLLAALPFCIGLIALADPIADAFDNPDLALPLRLMAVVVLGQGMFLLFRAVFASIARVSLTWIITVLESALEVTASVALVAAGAGAAGAVLGRGVGYVLGTVIAVFVAIRHLGRRAVRERTSGNARRLITYGGALFVVTVAYTLFEQIDVLLIGAIIGTTASGIFEAPLRLTTFLSYGGLALAMGVAPRLARGTEGPNVEAFMRGTRYLVIFQAALLPWLLAWSGPIVDLTLGSGYEESVDVLRALTPYVFLLGIGTFITLGVNYLGEARRRVPLAVACVLVNLVMDLVLLPRIGVVGGAVSTNVAFTLYVGGHFWICKTILGIPLRPLGASLLRCMVAAGAATLVMAAFGTSSLSPAEWVAGGLAGMATYALVLFATREVKPSELADLRGDLMSRLRPAGRS